MLRRAALIAIAVVVLLPPASGIASVHAMTGQPPVPQPPGHWSMFKNFPDRQGRTQLVGSRTGTLLWRVQAGTNAGGAAIGLDGTVYQGTTNSTLIAINPDGTVKWTVHVPRAVGSTPALTLDGKVVFVPEDGNVYAVNLDGTPAWHFLTGDTFPSPSGSPAIGPDGTVYTGIDETFYALNQDGSLKWSYSPGGLIGGPPALSRTGRIYVPIDDDLFALDLAGAFLWRYDVQSPYGLSSAPAVAPDGTIYANSVGNTLFALHPDGSLAWRHHTDDFVIDVASSPALAKDGTIYVGQGLGVFLALNPDGSVKWRRTTNVAIATPAVDGEGTIYVGTDLATLYAINPDGSLKWSYNDGGLFNYVRTPPAIGDDHRVYAGSGLGVFAIGEL